MSSICSNGSILIAASAAEAPAPAPSRRRRWDQPSAVSRVAPGDDRATVPLAPCTPQGAPPAALASALAEENLKNQVSQSKEFCDSSGREVAELDFKQGKAGKGPAANVLVLNLVARFDFVGIRDFSQKNKSRSLKGLPISLRTRRQLEKLPPASLKLLQVQFFLLTP